MSQYKYRISRSMTSREEETSLKDVGASSGPGVRAFSVVHRIVSRDTKLRLCCCLWRFSAG